MAIKARDIPARLSRLLTTRQKLITILVFAHMYVPIGRYYRERHKRRQFEVGDASNLRREDDLSGVFDQHQSEIGSCDFGRPNESSSEQGSSREQQDRPVIPPVNLITILYYSLTTVYHVLGLFRSTGLILIQNGYLNLQKHLNCYIIGRLCFHVDIAYLMPYFELHSNMTNLNWRLRTMVIEWSYRLDCVPFLLSQEGRDDTPPINRLKDFEFIKASTRPLLKEPPNDYLREVLYVEMNTGENGTSEFYLRPNRTSEAKAHLGAIVNKVSVYCATLTLLIVGSSMPIIFITGFFDINYIVNYPTCSPHLEKLAQEGRLGRWSTSVFSLSHRGLTISFDVLINAIVWSEDLFFVLFPTSVAILVIEDLMIYWRFLRRALDRLLCIMQCERGFHAPRDLEWSSRLQVDTSITVNSLSNILEQQDHDWKTSAQRANYLLLDKQVKILQHLLVDFFRQLRHYDRYISFVITTYLELWAVLFVSTGYLGVYTDSQRVVYIVRCVQVGGVVSLGGLIIYMLRLSKYTKDAYPILCAIMAHESNFQRKESWSHILETYTSKLTYGFTVFFTHQLTWMTLLNYLATTVSFLVAIETFRRKDK